MLRLAFSIVLGSFALLIPATVSTSDYQSTKYEVYQESPLWKYVALVDEFDLRRRVNVLFKNRQSIFDGMQIGFVNVGTGNLTFRRRDLVVPECGTFIFERVYDSRIRSNDDFGSGWRLAFNEALFSVDIGFKYMDSSGSTRTFLKTDTGTFVQLHEPPHVTSTITASDDFAVMRSQDGSVRTFMRMTQDGTYQLISIQRKNCDRVDFEFNRGAISAVRSSAGVIFAIGRDAENRIIEVRDAHGRTVRYSYDELGQLATIIDIAGNRWRYEYGKLGKLTKAIGPNQLPLLKVEYDSSGLVETTRSGRSYSYRYLVGETIVTQGTGQRHQFIQDNLGATVGFQSSTGIAWQIEFSHTYRVRSFNSNDLSLRFDYDARGLIETIDHRAAGQSHQAKLYYDQENRLSRLEHDSGEWAEVHYDSDSVFIHSSAVDLEIDSRLGLIESIRDGLKRIDIDRDPNGDVIFIRTAGNSINFDRDNLQRITATRFYDRQLNRYEYDRLGNRRLFDTGRYGQVTYEHDPSGNIVKTEIVGPHGESFVQRTLIGEMNRVEQVDYEGSTTLDVAYNELGQPVTFRIGDESVKASYSENGVLSRLTSIVTDEAIIVDKKESDEIHTQDLIRAVLMQDPIMTSQAGHDLITFDELAFKPTFVNVENHLVPILGAARNLLSVTAELFQQDLGASIRQFERPSNPVFQPREYRSTNCCIACIGNSCSTCTPGSDGAYGHCYCFPPDLFNNIGGGGGGGGGGGISDVTLSDIKVNRTGEVTAEDDRLVKLGSTIMRASESVSCESSGDKYRLTGQATIGEMSIEVATRIRVGSCRESVRTTSEINGTIAHEQKHAQKILDVINESNDDPVLGKEFDTFQQCTSAMNTWLGEYQRALSREQRRQVYHCDHVDEFKVRISCPIDGGHTRETVSDEQYDDPGAAICNP